MFGSFDSASHPVPSAKSPDNFRLVAAFWDFEPVSLYNRGVFQLKICGITSIDDARMCASLGADALGLNCYPGSSRYIPMFLAEQVAAAIPEGVAKVGLFVNERPEEANRLVKQLGLDYVQLHGDEPPDELLAYEGKPVIRALRLGQHNLRALIEYVDRARKLNIPVAAWLIDGWTPGQYGGAGKSPPMDDVLTLKRHLAPERLILAGGLRPDNVAEAIERLAPDAVDVCSGVETSPRQKDRDQTRTFLMNAKAAFQTQR
jgi:phosphoribosylanthranilate isomerase